jgi:hypothetical protein
METRLPWGCVDVLLPSNRYMLTIPKSGYQDKDVDINGCTKLMTYVHNGR